MKLSYDMQRFSFHSSLIFVSEQKIFHHIIIFPGWNQCLYVFLFILFFKYWKFLDEKTAIKISFIFCYLLVIKKTKKLCNDTLHPYKLFKHDVSIAFFLTTSHFYQKIMWYVYKLKWWVLLYNFIDYFLINMLNNCCNRNYAELWVFLVDFMLFWNLSDRFHIAFKSVASWNLSDIKILLNYLF